MKPKLIAISAAVVLLIGCGKTEEAPPSDPVKVAPPVEAVKAIGESCSQDCGGGQTAAIQCAEGETPVCDCAKTPNAVCEPERGPDPAR